MELTGKALTEKRVTCRVESAVAYVTLASVEDGNALNRRMLTDLRAAMLEARESACRAIVIQSAAEAFCAGLDLAEAADAAGAPAEDFVDLAAACLRDIAESPVPVIACVDGAAMGGGVGLAAACDIVLCSERGSFTLSEVLLGLIPALIAPFLLRRLTSKRLCYMMLSSRQLRGAEAREWGLVDELAGEAGLDSTLNANLRRLLCSAPHALAHCKRYVAELEPLQFAQQTAHGANRLKEMLADGGTREALRVFADGGAPPWFQKHRGAGQ